MKRRFWFDLHSWVGLKLSVLLFFILLSGTLAVVAHEIDWLINPDMRVMPAEETVSAGAQLDAALAAHPGWKVRSLYLPRDPWFATELWFTTEEGRTRRVYVNPYSAEVQGDARWFNAHRFLRESHRHLMMPVNVGVPIVCAFAFFLLISAISSLWVYKKWWKGFFQWPRPERQRRFWGDLHRLCGVWSLAFIMLIVVTGVWYLIEEWGGSAPPAARFPAGVEGEAPRVDGVFVDARLAEIAERYPGLEVTEVRFPQRSGQALVFVGQTDAVLVRDRANGIAFDPLSGEEIQRHHGSQLSLHQRIAEAADPLHFGNFAGWWSKLPWFIFGLMLTTLSATGIWLYGMRVTRETSIASQLALAWNGMGPWRWLALGLLAVMLVFFLPVSVSK